MAQTPHILFVDGDDELPPFALQWLHERMGQHPGDCISWMMRGQWEPFDEAALHQAATAFTADQLQAYIVGGKGSNVTNRVFSSSLIHGSGLLFDTALARGEDGAFAAAYTEQFFKKYPQAAVHHYPAQLYIIHRDNAAGRASNKKIKAHPIVWNKQQSKGYAARLMQEYAQLVESMNGYEAMSATDRLHITHQYARRFAFAVWAAHQLGETLPEGFWGEGAVGGLVATMKHYKLYNAYYWPLRLKWQWLVCKTYHSDESESKKLFWRVHLAGDILLGRTWSRL